MAGTYQTYKFSYNTTVDEITVNTLNVTRSQQQNTVIRQTPTGERYRQRFGSIKYTWGFLFNTNTAREVLDVFQDAYDYGQPVTMSEEQNDGSFTDYTVLVGLPSYSPDVIGSSAVDRGLSVEVLQA